MSNRRSLVAALICTTLTIATLAPFATKAFHIDDTVYLYVARQICAHPADPYGLTINWFGYESPMADVTQNGPLSSYYIALVAGCFGWGEAALHLAFLVPAVAAVLGTYFLALRFCTEPLIAALATLLCPVFMVSSTTVMSDMIMLAFWVWAVVLWLRSAEGGNHIFFILSALLIAAAAVTKYFAVTLIPLLLAYSLLRWPRVRWRVLYLAISVVVLLWYDLAMRSMYGHSMLYGAGSYVLLLPGRYSSNLLQGLTALGFMGGCLATVIFYAPLLWSRRVLVFAFLGTALMACVLFFAKSLGDFDLPGDNQTRILIVLQFAVFVVAGIGLLALAIADLWHSRDAGSSLLFLWMVGTFIFCWIFNWTVNGRSILPMAPAASILIVRRIYQYTKNSVGRRFSWEFLPLIFVGLLSVAVTWADARLADTGRVAAAEIYKRYGGEKCNVLFGGHWGFQYYMESYGFKALNFKRLDFVPSDVLILPENNSNVPPIPPGLFSETATLEWISSPVLATMQIRVGAGFYASVWGPLPFAFCSAPAEIYHVMTLTPIDEVNPQIRQYEPVVEQHPDSVAALGKLANALLSAGKTLEARKYLAWVMQLNSDDAEAHNNLAIVLAMTGQPQEAIKHFQQGLQIEPHDADAQFNFGLVLANTGRPQEAIEHFHQALRIKPDYPQAHLNLGLAMAKGGQSFEAINYFEQALQLKPDYYEAHFNIGLALANVGRLQQAIDHYEQALHVKPNYPEAEYNLGLTLANSGRPQEAITHFMRAAELKPKYIEAYSNLVLIYAQTNQPAEAIAAAQKAIDLARSQGDTTQAKQIEDWLKFYRASLSDLPSTPP
ncbi:MAG TPA: tetratricopeptide repeat protein [Thermoguttaceae bacterium]